METNIENNKTQPNDETNELHHQSYILRLWKSSEGALKGYVLDPITNKTFPLVNIPIHWDLGSDSPVSEPDCENPLIEPFGCYLGVWQPQK